MKLKFAIVCDNAFTDPQGRLSIIQTFDNISAPNFPALHPRVSIVTSYSLDKDDDKSKTFTQVLKIINTKTGKEVFKAEKTLTPMAGRDSFVQYIANIIGLAFPNDGKYEILSQLNEKDFGVIASINVTKETN